MDENSPEIVALRSLTRLLELVGYPNEYDILHDVLTDCLYQVGYNNISPYPGHDLRRRAVAMWILYIMALIGSSIPSERNQAAPSLKQLLDWIEQPPTWVSQPVVEGLRNALTALEADPVPTVTTPPAP